MIRRAFIPPEKTAAKVTKGYPLKLKSTFHQLVYPIYPQLSLVGTVIQIASRVVYIPQ
jgi:hypothetical protein